MYICIFLYMHRLFQEGLLISEGKWTGQEEVGDVL